MATLVIATDLYDIITAQNINDLEMASKEGDNLVVIVPNDEQLYRKDNFAFPFTREYDRLEIIRRLPFVTFPLLSKDMDFSIKETLSEILGYYAESMPENILLHAKDLTFEDEQFCKKHRIRVKSHYINSR